ncbi:hypothetical protein [Thermoanaerobacterium sp. RBIITD]|uniref:hypothetical protein n=1 Tax=Thermoanaerobacterium sp. RBIITD TaxID=1550240 RepID=UPI000BB87044|nr:hypothetical protein [Thermoanaerobacterium sp. RBIITD]SNX53148.1 hypothetical protein SAMN05660242_0647 [Thermoanaerobacterium sp. RBIITD]
MKKIITYNFIMLVVTAVSIIFMLNLQVKEQQTIHDVVKPQNTTYTQNSNEIGWQNHLPLTVFSGIYDETLNQDIKDKKVVENKKNDIQKDVNKDDNKKQSDYRDFKEEMLQKLIQQRERNYEESTNKSETKSVNLNRVVVTPEKILKVQREMDFEKKSKAIGLLVKLGPSGLGEIMKMSQDGVTPAEGYRMMDILKEHLSDDEIKFLKDIVSEYFLDEANKNQ